ncbi:CPBP family intramembrane glutamic endopeptidase [Enterovibrio calviensis]|uniref:CPBP family intramembrane glutamic endopeptidase n=1 Tax=Enterovibrio calviensis TaxID=91359 RepID=UPI000489FF18|nr:CPBP family intramembrane glutamic endopeptidase [Enterovibrio calviensis]
MSLLAILLGLVVGLSFLYPRFISDRLGFIFMLPVIIYTVYFYIEWQFVSLFQLGVIISGGVCVGVALLFAGLPISAPKPKDFFINSARGLRLGLGFLKNNRDYLLFQVGITCYEELIWRVFLISALLTMLPAWAAVCLSSVLFWTVHEENRPMGWHSLEFFIFATVLGVAYILTGSLLFVWMVHLTRNVLILSASYYEAHQAS